MSRTITRWMGIEFKHIYGNNREDEIMTLIGKKISQKNYGEGIVQDDDGKYITIFFPKFNKKKTFE